MQTEGVVEKDFTSIANFAKWGAGVPHMSFKLPVPASRKGGGGSSCMYIYSYINMYKQHSCRLDGTRGPKVKRRSYTPPPPEQNSGQRSPGSSAP